MKREDIIAACVTNPDAVADLVESLMATVSELVERVKILEDQVNKNSRNSSKPPSTDGFNKPKSQRRKSGKPAGGQNGHPGHTLKMVANPDHTVVHPVSCCSGCGSSLEQTPVKGYERRQVFDLPPIRVETTEHKAEKKVCPHCGCQNRASFPAGVQQPVQYGPQLKAVAVYLNQYQLLPYERTSELFADLFNHNLSQATLVNANQACYLSLADAEEKVKQLIQASPVVNCDETGVRIEGKLNWLHVVSTEKVTHYAVHAKRGHTATQEIGILPEFSGVAVHDSWKPYYQYGFQHALCNAHHLRELTGILEQDKQEWPREMIELLLEIKKAVEQAKVSGKSHLTSIQIEDFLQRYGQIIEKGLAENPPPDPGDKPGKRGKKKQSKAKNLLDRLDEHRREVLAFMYDFRIPFDNNQAERDIRMTKVQQKISGVFRSTQGAKAFCRIRGYISTVRKNCFSVIDAIRAAFHGDPFVPAIPEQN